ncbi:hypothetical protein PQQ81_02620 [Paraburkholderia strydomiana]|uniref:hypothetical protein n=1 Tax=Paraburkholderia strydomiana TaxID=1245417 RepID=UPI0038B73CCE
MTGSTRAKVPTFQTKDDIYKFDPPEDKPSREVKYAGEQAGLYARIMKRRKDGVITRLYFVRLTSGPRKGKPQTLGPIESMTIKQAVKRAADVLAEARGQAADIKAAVQAGLNPDSVLPLTLSDAWTRYLKDYAPIYLSKTSVDGYEQKMKPLLSEHGAKDVRGLDEVFWLGVYQSILVRDLKPGQKLKINMAAGTKRVVSSLYEFLLMHKLVKVNPIYLIHPKALKPIPRPRQRYVAREDMSKFMSDLEERVQNPQREFILFMLFTGFRVSLMGSLTFARINREKRGYWIYPGDIGAKGIKEEILYPIPDYVWERVIEPRLRRRGLMDPSVKQLPDEPIFQSPRRKDKPLVSIKGSFYGMTGRTGLDSQSHPIRKTIATLAADTPDVNGFAVSRLLTHTDTARSREADAVTRLYVQTPYVTLRKASNLVANEILIASGLIEKSTASEAA